MIRQSGMRAFRSPPGADVEASFRIFVEGQLEAARPALASDDASVADSVRSGVFVLAMALFTYGRADMIPLILDTIPPPNTHIIALASALRELLPLPTTVGSRDFRAIRDWFAEHGGELRWDEGMGQFVLAGAGA